MLRSYQYSEIETINRSIQNPNFRKKEGEIARKYVIRNHEKRKMNRECPICGEGYGDYYYSKWGIDYLCCSRCKSIYADIYDETAYNYQSNEELLEFRLNEAYQADAAVGRKELWKEFLEWVEIRSFRFIHRNTGLRIIDVGNRFRGYVKLIRESELCMEYNLRSSILGRNEDGIEDGCADIVFYVDQMQKEPEPSRKLKEIYKYLSDDGLLFLGTRAGSGFDILTLKENNDKIFPYEHITLPSVKGLTTILESNGFRVLEITTPGVMDVSYVLNSINRLDDRESFVKYLLEESDHGILQEFQRFLQKSCLSSFVRVVACKA